MAKLTKQELSILGPEDQEILQDPTLPKTSKENLLSKPESMLLENLKTNRIVAAENSTVNYQPLTFEEQVAIRAARIKKLVDQNNSSRII